MSWCAAIQAPLRHFLHLCFESGRLHVDWNRVCWMTALGVAIALMLKLLKVPLHTLRPAMTPRQSKRTQRRGRLPCRGVMLHRVASLRRRRRWQLRSGSSVRTIKRPIA